MNKKFLLLMMLVTNPVYAGSVNTIDFTLTAILPEYTVIDIQHQHFLSEQQSQELVDSTDSWQINSLQRTIEDNKLPDVLSAYINFWQASPILELDTKSILDIIFMLRNDSGIELFHSVNESNNDDVTSPISATLWLIAPLMIGVMAIKNKVIA